MQDDFRQLNTYESFDDKIDIDLDELSEDFSNEESSSSKVPKFEEKTSKAEQNSKLHEAIEKRNEKIINRKTIVGRKTKGKVIHGVQAVKTRKHQRKPTKERKDTFWDKISDKINGRKERIKEKRRSFEKERRKAIEQKNEEKDNELNRILDRRETFGALIVLFITFVVFSIALIFSNGARKETPEEMSLIGIHEEAESFDAEDLILEGYRDFEKFDYNVKNAPLIELSEETAGTNPEEETEKSKNKKTEAPTPTEVPEETSEPTEYIVTTPTEEPTATPSQEKKKIVIADGEDYYLFNFDEDGYSTTKLELGGVYVTGIGRDCGVSLDIGQNGYDLDYGDLLIQNPYNVPSFSLRDIMDTPLLVTKGGTIKSPRIILCYTHTSEGYCITEEERVIRTTKTITGYDTTRNIVGRGNTIETILKRAGVGVINIKTACDEVASNAYTVSSAAISEAADSNPTCELTIDLHVTEFEYPTGTRYSKVATADGKNYAPIQLIVTVNDETNPSWKENLKLALLLIDKMNEKVPGISLGISLTNESKYNTTETYYGLTVELGFAGNLVEEADNTAALLGTVLAEIYS